MENTPMLESSGIVPQKLMHVKLSSIVS